MIKFILVFIFVLCIGGVTGAFGKDEGCMGFSIILGAISLFIILLLP